MQDKYRVIVSLSFADGKYKRFQGYNSISAKNIGGVSNCFNYTSTDIDPEFKRINSEIFSIERGSGLWLWKPYLIDKTLNQINDGEYLVYTDAAVVFLKNINSLVDKLDSSNQEIMLFDLPLIELQWTNPSVFQHLEANSIDITFSNQRNGAIIIIKKSDATSAFIKRWLTLCCNINLLKASDSTEDKPNLYINHREDQSILSVLSKQYKIRSFTDPTDYGRNPFPYIYYNTLFRIAKKSDEYSVKDVYFLHHRGYNIVIYYLKFIILTVFTKYLFKVR